MSKLFHLSGDRIEKTDGTFAAGAKIDFWEAGTSTRLDTYSDNALSSANTNPVVCDENGLVPAIFLKDDLYKFQITDADDNVLVSAVDNYDGGDGTETIDAGTAGGTADALTLTVDGVTAYETDLKLRFLVASDNTTTTPTINVNGLGAKTVVRQDGSALAAADLKSGYKREVSYLSGVDKFQLIAADGTDGSDGSDGVFAAHGSVTEAVVATGDSFPFYDVDDSNNPKRDTIQGILDLFTGETADAWANLNGTGTIALNDSFNIASVADNGTGDYTFTLTNAMGNANYSAVFGKTENSGGGDGIYGAFGGTRSTTQLQIESSNASAALVDANHLSVAIFGD